MGAVEDIIKANLALTEEKKQLWQRLRMHQFAQALQENKPEASPADIGAYYANLCGVPDTTENLCGTEFAYFCTYITELFGWRYPELNAEPEELDSKNRKTAYLQNSFSDKAYGLFSEEIPGMTAEYYPGFAEACEEVYDNRCKYVILPLYTSSDGRLISFQKLIAKYDLKICMTAEINLSDENKMHFALLRKGIAVPVDHEFMDITLVLSEDVPMGRFLSACEALGASTLTMNTIPLAYADETEEFCIHFHTAKADIAALILFFEASQIRYTLNGIYSHIRT
ncbi:MAG: hypothetical protein IJ325_05175 [Clostridia bacterium]|nr:hypothetical protein [Clostridia bacterium]